MINFTTAEAIKLLHLLLFQGIFKVFSNSRRPQIKGALVQKAPLRGSKDNSGRVHYYRLYGRQVYVTTVVAKYVKLGRYTWVHKHIYFWQMMFLFSLVVLGPHHHCHHCPTHFMTPRAPIYIPTQANTIRLSVELWQQLKIVCSENTRFHNSDLVARLNLAFYGQISES